tara:strand:- start:19 stop:219 length:201 start_codon:yes stop_codon:yes gene_type:complete
MSVTEQMMLYAEEFQQRTEYLEALVKNQHRETYDLLLKILEIVEQIEYNNRAEVINDNRETKTFKD